MAHNPTTRTAFEVRLVQVNDNLFVIQTQPFVDKKKKQIQPFVDFLWPFAVQFSRSKHYLDLMVGWFHGDFWFCNSKLIKTYHVYF